MCICLAWAAPPLSAGPITVLVAHVKLPRGVELDVPKGFGILGRDYLPAVKAKSDKGLDLSKRPLRTKGSANLMAATWRMNELYAEIRVDSIVPSPYAPAVVSNATPEQLEQLSEAIRQRIRAILEKQGLQLLHFYPVQKTQLAGYPALVISFRRSGHLPRGPFDVEIDEIYTDTQEVRLNLSYREQEKSIWSDAVEHVKRSLVIHEREGVQRLADRAN